MTVNVVRNSPPPAVTPPDTYDITGLTYDQAVVIRDLLGLVGDSGKAGTYPVYTALYSALPGVGQDCQVTAGDGNNTRLVQVLNIHPLG
jgi:hypothetical protein